MDIAKLSEQAMWHKGWGWWHPRWQLFDEIGALLCEVEYSRYHHGWHIDLPYYGREKLRTWEIDTTPIFADADSAIRYLSHEIALKSKRAVCRQEGSDGK